MTNTDHVTPAIARLAALLTDRAYLLAEVGPAQRLGCEHLRDFVDGDVPASLNRESAIWLLSAETPEARAARYANETAEVAAEARRENWLDRDR